MQTTTHFIGEGFGGGIIFYLSAAGDHGLIADTVDLPLALWMNVYITTGATVTSLGTGKANTKAIIAAQGQTGLHYAALECAKSKRSGYTDWYLPSRDELNELYKQKNVVGGFAGSFYYSSSEYDLNFVWGQSFYYGWQSPNSKDYAAYVRAVRGF